MEPMVLKGDRMLADKTADRRITPKKNDIFISERSKQGVHEEDRRLPCDLIERPDGKKETVPNG
jgi:hypothetical protein